MYCLSIERRMLDKILYFVVRSNNNIYLLQLGCYPVAVSYVIPFL